MQFHRNAPLSEQAEYSESGQRGRNDGGFGRDERERVRRRRIRTIVGEIGSDYVAHRRTLSSQAYIATGPRSSFRAFKIFSAFQKRSFATARKTTSEAVRLRRRPTKILRSLSLRNPSVTLSLHLRSIWMSEVRGFFWMFRSLVCWVWHWGWDDNFSCAKYISRWSCRELFLFAISRDVVLIDSNLWCLWSIFCNNVVKWYLNFNLANLSLVTSLDSVVYVNIVSCVC